MPYNSSTDPRWGSGKCAYFFLDWCLLFIKSDCLLGSELNKEL